MERSLRDGLGELRTCGLHKWRVEGSADGEGEGPLRAGFLGLFAGSVNRGLLAGDDYLTVGVIVGGDDGAVGLRADFLYCLVGQADNGGHASGHLLAAFLHGGGSGGDEPQGILEIEGAGCSQGREFAEGMAGHHVGGEAVVAFGEDYRVQEHCRLGHLGGLESLGIISEHYVGNLESEYFVGRIKKLFCLGIVLVKFFSHARELGPLSGEDICFLHLYKLFQPANLIILVDKNQRIFKNDFLYLLPT